MRTLAGEKVNEKNMITNYDAHGFMVAAEELPKACTACPFWLCRQRNLKRANAS